MDILKFIKAVELSGAATREDELFSVYYISPYLIQVPNDINYVLINKVGPRFMPYEKLGELWENKIPYSIDQEHLICEWQGNCKKVAHEGEKQLNFLKCLIPTLSWDMDSYQSLNIYGDSCMKVHTETFTLANEDLIIIQYEYGNLVEMRHFMK